MRAMKIINAKSIGRLGQGWRSPNGSGRTVDGVSAHMFGELYKEKNADLMLLKITKSMEVSKMPVKGRANSLLQTRTERFFKRTFFQAPQKLLDVWTIHFFAISVLGRVS